MENRKLFRTTLSLYQHHVLNSNLSLMNLYQKQLMSDYKHLCNQKDLKKIQKRYKVILLIKILMKFMQKKQEPEKPTLFFFQTPHVIGKFLRGWQMDVQMEIILNLIQEFSRKYSASNLFKIGRGIQKD